MTHKKDCMCCPCRAKRGDHPLKGKKRPAEVRAKISKSLIGNVIPEKIRAKISATMKGRPPNNNKKGSKLSEEHKQKISEGCKGKNYTLEQRRRYSLSKLGSLNPQWVDGRGVDEYPFEFNDELREQIRERDGYRCLECNCTEEVELKEVGRALSVHHVDLDKQNSAPDNLASLCDSCHSTLHNLSRRLHG